MRGNFAEWSIVLLANGARPGMKRTTGTFVDRVISEASASSCAEQPQTKKGSSWQSRPRWGGASGTFLGAIALTLWLPTSKSSVSSKEGSGLMDHSGRGCEPVMETVDAKLWMVRM